MSMDKLFSLTFSQKLLYLSIVHQSAIQGSAGDVYHSWETQPSSYPATLCKSDITPNNSNTLYFQVAIQPDHWYRYMSAYVYI